MPVRVAINGFGRTGRCMLRAAVERDADLEVVAINDLAEANVLAHLLRRDSVFGRFPGEVEPSGSGLRVAGREIAVFSESDPELVRRSMRLRIHGSVALDLAWLAAGRMSATVALSNLPWDVSAGVLLVREAGGLVLDAEGAAHQPASWSTLATTPALRASLLSVISAAQQRVSDPTREPR